MAALSMNSNYRVRASWGFTLVELMVTITVLGVLLGIALPAFRDFILDQRVKNASFELNTTLQYARSEAVKRNDSAVIEPVSGNWANGYAVTVGSSTLKNVSSLDGITVTGPAEVRFRGDGRTSLGGESSFVLGITPARTGVSSRCISLDASGLPINVLGDSC